MSSTSDVTDHAAVFAALLKPITPAEPLRVSVVARLAPWAPHFVEARKAGYSWAQLAEIAANPEIGIALPPERLRRFVNEALHAENGEAPPHPRHHKKRAASAPAAGSPPAPSASAVR